MYWPILLAYMLITIYMWYASIDQPNHILVGLCSERNFISHDIWLRTKQRSKDSDDGVQPEEEISSRLNWPAKVIIVSSVVCRHLKRIHSEMKNVSGVKLKEIQKKKKSPLVKLAMGILVWGLGLKREVSKQKYSWHGIHPRPCLECAECKSSLHTTLKILATGRHLCAQCTFDRPAEGNRAISSLSHSALKTSIILSGFQWMSLSWVLPRLDSCVCWDVMIGRAVCLMYGRLFSAMQIFPLEASITQCRSRDELTGDTRAAYLNVT